MEDTMDDELTETPTALTDNITPEMASNKVTDDSGSLVHKVICCKNDEQGNSSDNSSGEH